jgi:hypothetical protein
VEGRKLFLSYKFEPMILQISYINGSSKQVELPRSFSNREWVKIGSRSYSPCHAITLDENELKPVHKYSVYDDKGNFIEGATINTLPVVETTEYNKTEAKVAKLNWKNSNGKYQFAV